jgi:hypothetical protein
MKAEQFENIINNRIETCKSVLCSKAEEYATDDRLHNFKIAGELQKCTPVKALGGMMSKHTVSVYDLIEDYEQGKAISKEMWDEKIGDSINYLLLLTALLEDENNARADRLLRQLRQWQALNDKPISVEDWNNESKKKWFIIYSYSSEEMYAEYYYIMRLPNTIYFATKEKAEEAIKVFEDELLWYFTEYVQRLDEMQND